MSESLFDKIAQDNTNDYFTKEWRNGKDGAISDHKGLNIYKFYVSVRDEKGKLRNVYLNNPERENSAPIMAAGIAAYWIHHRKSANRLTSLFSKPEQFAKSIREQFEAYTNIRFSQFKKQNKDNPDTWDWDGEYEFYCKYIIPLEMGLNKLSEAIFEYVTEDDAKELRKVMDNYIEFLKARRKELGYDISDELKVLRAFDSRDEYQFEDLSEDEIIVILDRLEADKCVKVAWNSGHKWSAVSLLPLGKVYMKQLLEQSRIKTNGENEIDLLRKRVAELEAKLNKNGDEERENEIVEELKSCFYGNKTDARAFLHQIKGVPDKDKPAIAKQYMIEDKLRERSARRPLTTILKKYHLYSRTEINWNSMFNKA